MYVLGYSLLTYIIQSNKDTLIRSDNWHVLAATPYDEWTELFSHFYFLVCLMAYVSWELNLG